MAKDTIVARGVAKIVPKGTAKGVLTPAKIVPTVYTEKKVSKKSLA